MQSPLKSFRKARERKRAKVITQHGIALLEKEFQHKAMFEIQKALDIDPTVVAELLLLELNRFMEQGDDKTALSIGLIALKIKPEDYLLANTLGNCARRIKDYKQANNLYRQAFRLNRAFDIALYNLAASLAHIPLFDNRVKELIEPFSRIHHFVLPRYKNDPAFIENISAIIKQESGYPPTRQPEEPFPKIKETPGSSSLHLSEKRPPMPTTPSYTEICSHIRRLIQEIGKDLSSEVKVSRFEGTIFNLGLYALSEKDTTLALKCFLQLKNRKSSLSHLDMVITLAMDVENPTPEILEHMKRLLEKDKRNRYLNVNLGLMFRNRKNRILSYKYLALGAVLLKKTHQIYCRRELVERGDQELEIGNLEQALKYYLLVDSEITDARAKSGIGQVLLYQNHYLEAIPPLKVSQELEPENALVQQKLSEIHDYFVRQGEEFCQTQNYSLAAASFHNALEATRQTATLKQTAKVHRQLLDTKTADALMKEYTQRIQRAQAEQAEQSRRQTIKKGKQLFEQNDLDAALACFEQVFSQKTDKEVFSYMFQILKRQKNMAKLKALNERWKQMIHTNGLSFDHL